MAQRMTELELEILTRLVCAIRPEWNENGVRAMLGRLGMPLPDATARAVAAVLNPDAQTPAALLWNPPPLPPDTARPGLPNPCRHCGRTEWACWRAQLNTGLDTHTYAPTGDAPESPAVRYAGAQPHLWGVE